MEQISEHKLNSIISILEWANWWKATMFNLWKIAEITPKVHVNEPHIPYQLT